MFKKTLAASIILLAVAVPAGARPASQFVRSHCPFVVSVKHDEHAANRIYADTRKVTLHDERQLGYYERCQRNPQAQWFVRSYNRARWQQHFRRVQDASTPWQHAVASWYDDSGTTGCGFHTTYGIATDIIGCGQSIRLKGPGGEVIATRDDSPGPGVAAGGRTFDLNPATKAALGCGDLCDVKWAASRP